MTMKFTFLLGLTLTVLSACGGGEASEETSEKQAETVVRPKPVTTTSGNSFEWVNTLGVIDEYQTGNQSTLKYTILDYTTNFVFDKLPIDEMSVPTDEEQLVKVTIEAKVLSLINLNCKEPLKGFDLNFGGADVDAFTRFSAEFNEKSTPKCLAVNETQTFDVYFRVPMDADLSKAKISLYIGGSEEGPEANLNK